VLVVRPFHAAEYRACALYSCANRINFGASDTARVLLLRIGLQQAPALVVTPLMPQAWPRHPSLMSASLGISFSKKEAKGSRVLAR